MITPEAIEKLRDRYDRCFACGRANRVGMHLDGFRLDGDELIADYQPLPEHQGFDSTLHGGIIAAALDEAMAWAVILVVHTLAVTGTMEIRFTKPAGTAGSYQLRARVDHQSGRRLRASAELTKDSQVVSRARGLYLATTPVADLLGENPPPAL